MDRLDGLLKHIGHYSNDMSEDEKIKSVLNIVYMNLINTKVEIFDKMTSTPLDGIRNLFNSVFNGEGIPEDDESENLQKVRQKFINYLIKYEKKPTNNYNSCPDRFNNWFCCIRNFKARRIY